MSKSAADFCGQRSLCGCDQRNSGPQAIFSWRHNRTGFADTLCFAEAACRSDLLFP